MHRYWLLLVLTVFVPIAGSSVADAPRTTSSTWPLGAAVSDPEQRTGTPGSGMPADALPVPARVAARPADAVPDRVDAPPVRPHEHGRQQVKPAAV
jgi:hypothetical protein